MLAGRGLNRSDVVTTKSLPPRIYADEPIHGVMEATNIKKLNPPPICPLLIRPSRQSQHPGHLPSLSPTCEKKLVFPGEKE